MMKQCFLIISLFLIFVPSVFWAQDKVEDVFWDIWIDYDYILELQALYNRGIIIDDGSWMFRPSEPLRRDIFTWVSQEIQCDRCIEPHTPSSTIEKYLGEDIFFDIDNTSPYFYCIAEADNRNLISQYSIWTTCWDGSSEFWERPFCPWNTVSREEAASYLLRSSNIFTQEDNIEVIDQIQKWEISENLWNDITPLDSEGNPNTTYWYLRRALTYKIIEYDVLGNEQIYSFFEVDASGDVSPDTAITNEDFLKMAYIILKTNQCSVPQDLDLAITIDVLDAICNSSDEDCSFSDLNSPGFEYDFRSRTQWVCPDGIDDPTGYTWRFYNQTSWEEFFEYGKYIDDVLLTPSWEWTIYQSVKDRCGNVWQVYSTLTSLDANSTKNTTLSTTVKASEIWGFQNFLVNLEASTSWGTPPYTYFWELWDGQVQSGKNIEYIYEDVGIYKIVLSTQDSLGLTWSASMSVQVLSGDACSGDIDSDGLNNCIDVCPSVSGSEENRWCPIYEASCDTNCGCGTWYICDDSDALTCWVSGVCVPDFEIESSCLYNPNIGSVFWNTLCTSCPCTSSIDFLADIRRCDLLFPAITSPDGTEIYSQWNFWEVR